MCTRYLNEHPHHPHNLILPCLCRGLTIGNPVPENFYIDNENFYAGTYAVHSLPNFFFANGISTTITLEDSSGATFGLQSFYIAGYPPTGGNNFCNELFTISGSTGGVPNPACTVPSFGIGPASSPVVVTLNPPCFATTVTVQALNNNINCPAANVLTLDDITVCPTTTTSSIA